MYVYVNPFLAGVFCTIAVEAILIFVYAVYAYRKLKKLQKQKK